jgi:hypothetical protein
MKGSNPLAQRPELRDQRGRFGVVSKRVQLVTFRGPSREKSPVENFRFDYGKASNDKREPDPVGSGDISSACFLRRNFLVGIGIESA